MGLRLRSLLPLSLLALGLAGLAGFAWLSGHPDAAIVERAQSWPWVGGLAESFRDHYLGPEVGPPAGPEMEPTEVVIGQAPELGESEMTLGARPRVWVTAPTPLRAEASADAAELAWIEPVESLIELERRGDWFQVLWRGDRGWVHLPGYDAVSDPPLGTGEEPVRPLADRRPDPTRLALGLALLGEPEPKRVGGYALYSDLSEAVLEWQLEQATGSVETAYGARYGVDPIGEARAAILVFARLADYESFKAETPDLASLPATGHASLGIVALYRQGRHPSEVRATLVHELTHLLNRRAVGPALPPWLDEGLAEDLGASAVSAAGSLDPSRLADSAVRTPTSVRVMGAQAALALLQERHQAQALIPLAELLALDWRSFVGDPRSQELYALAGFLIRYLAGGDHAEGFSAFLAAVSRGEPATGAALVNRLETDWTELEDGFHDWIADQDSPLRL